MKKFMVASALSLIRQIVCIPTLHGTLSGPQIAHDLRSILSNDSGIYLRTDPVWATETAQRFDLWRQPTYVISVKPALARDVQQVVTYSASHNIPFLATGGGHGYSGSLGALQNGLELDLGNFNSVEVDPERNLLTIGGAVRFRDVEQKVYEAGKAIAVGECPCVGMAGASLGGGIGFLSGLYGAISDSLVSAEVITGTGSRLEVSGSQNSDLLWAMKGAGSSYGVATSLTFKVYDYVNGGYAMNADLVYSASQMKPLLEWAKSLLTNQKKELSIKFSLIYVPDMNDVLVTANVVYLGPLADGKAIIQPLMDLNPQRNNISYVPWYEVAATANFGQVAASCDAPRRETVPYSLNLYDMDVDALVAEVANFNQTVASTPALQGTLLVFSQYAQYGFQQHPASSSSYPWRDVAVFVQLDGSAANAGDVPAIDEFERGLRDRLVKVSGRSRLDVYMHFAHGDEGAAAWYSAAHVQRLRQLKRKYDPKSLFKFYNPVSA